MTNHPGQNSKSIVLLTLGPMKTTYISHSSLFLRRLTNLEVHPSRIRLAICLARKLIMREDRVVVVQAARKTKVIKEQVHIETNRATGFII